MTKIILALLIVIVLVGAGWFAFGYLNKSKINNQVEVPLVNQEINRTIPQASPQTPPTDSTQLPKNTQSPTQVYTQYHSERLKIQTFDDYVKILKKYNTKSNITQFEQKLLNVSEEDKKNILGFIKTVFFFQIKGFTDLKQQDKQAIFTVITDDSSTKVNVKMLLENGEWKIDSDVLDSKIN